MCDAGVSHSIPWTRFHAFCAVSSSTINATPQTGTKYMRNGKHKEGGISNFLPCSRLDAMAHIDVPCRNDRSRVHLHAQELEGERGGA